MTTATLEIDCVSYLLRLTDLIAEDFNAAYPGDVFDEEIAHTSLHSIATTVQAMRAFLVSLKPVEEA